MLFLVLIVAPALVVPLTHPVLAATYTPGVKPGDYFTFGDLLCQGSFCGQTFTNIRSFEFRVDSVSGPNVTISQIIHYVNGTSTLTGNSTSNVQKGVSFLLLAGGLTTGDRVDNETSAPIINSTLTQVYAGAPRSVNVLEISNTSASTIALFVWDQASGVLVQIREFLSGTFFFARVTSTNIWPPTSTPYFSGSPGTLHMSMNAGGSNQTLIAFTSVNNFTSAVVQAITIQPPGLTASINQTTIELVSGSSVTSSITVTAQPNIPPRLYFMTVTGTSGSLKDSVIITVNVTGPGPRFRLSASPTSLAFTVGSSGSATVSLTSLNAFAGTVALSAFSSPTGPSNVLSPASVILVANGTATSTLTVASAITGLFNVTVLGTHGTETERTVIQVTALPSATLNSTRLTLQPNGSNSTTLKISTDPVGHPFLAALANPEPNAALVSISPSAPAPGQGTGFNITANPSATTIVQGSTVVANVTLKSIGPYHGGIELSITVTDPQGVYVITVIATNGTLTRSANVTVTVQDFAMTPSAPLIVPCLISETCTVGIGSTPINGFSASLSLATTSSSGLTTNLNTNSISVPGSAILAISATTVGNYSATVTGTSGSLSHPTQTINVQVSDFDISANPVIINTLLGITGSSMIKVSPINGFSGTVVLSTSIFPLSGLGCSLSVTALGGGTTISGGSGTATLACQGTGGSYTVTVTGASGSLRHSTTVVVNLEDFTVSTCTPSLTIPAGGSGSCLITSGSLGGFTGPIALTSGSLPTGVTTTFVPNPATIATSGGTAVSTMQVSAAASVPAQTFTITIKGTSGTLSRMVNMTVTVTAGRPPTLTKITWRNSLELRDKDGLILPPVQLWKATVKNPQTGFVNVLVRIVGRSTSNASNTFDIVCGLTCVDTVGGGIDTTQGLTPVTIAGNNATMTFTFKYEVSPAFRGQTVKFTATLYWTSSAGTIYSSSTTKSGSFFVEGE